VQLKQETSYRGGNVSSNVYNNARWEDMQRYRSSMFIIIPIIILLLFGCLLLSQLVVSRILARFPGWHVDAVQWRFPNYFTLVNLQYTSADFDFMADVVIQVDWFKLLTQPMKALESMTFEQLQLNFHSKEKFSWQKMHKLIWVDQVLPVLPESNVNIVDGSITFQVLQKEVTVPISGTVELGKNTFLDLNVAGVRFDQLIVFAERVPWYGSGTWQAEQLDIQGSLAWHVNEETNLVVDYLRVISSEFKIWIDDAFRGQALNLNMLGLPIVEGLSLVVDGNNVRLDCDELDLLGHRLRYIHMDGLLVGDAPANWLAEGEFTFSMKWMQDGQWQQASGTVSQEDLAIEVSLNKVMVQLPEFPVQNLIIDAVFNISGSWQQPCITGSVLLHSGNYQDVELSGKADFEYLSQQLSLTALIDLLDGQLDIQGTVDLSQRTASGAVNATGINLAYLPFPELALTGIADFKGRFSEDGQHLIGTLQLTDAAWEQYCIDYAAAEILVGLDELQIIKADIVGAQSHYQVLGQLDLPTSDYELHVNLINGQAQELLGVFGLPVSDNLSGILEGYMQLRGNLRSDSEKINGRLLVDLVSGTIANEDITGSLDLSLASGRIAINRLRLKSNDGMIVAMGNYAQGELSLYSEAVNFPLSMVAGYFDPTFSLSGKINYSINISGELEQLNGQGQLSITEIYCDYGYFEALNTTLIFNHGELTLQPLYLVRDGAELIIEGTVGKLTKPDLHLQVSIPRNYIRELNSFIDGDLIIAGALPDLVIHGQLALSEIRYQIPFFDHIKQGQLQLVFQGQIVDVEGGLNFGHQREMIFNGQFDWQKKVVDFHLDSKKAPVNHQLLRGVANGHVQLTGDIDHLLLLADVQLDQGRIYLSGINGSSSQSTFLLPEVELDISLSSNQAAIYGPGIDLTAKGSLKVTGTSNEPFMHGEILTDGGTFNYFGTRFDITSGALQLIGWQTPMLTLTGVTRGADADIYLIVDGPIDQLYWRLDSQPSLPQDEILKRLNWLQLLDSFDISELPTDQLWDFLSTQANKALHKMEQALGNYLHLDLLDIKPDFGQRDLQIALGKYLWPNFYVSYQRNLFAGNHNDSLNVEYTLSQGLTLKSRIDNMGERRLGFEFKQRF